MNKDLKTVEAGDILVFTGNTRNALIKCERTTKTQIITTNGAKYRKSDGYIVGGGDYDTSQIRKATDDDIREIKTRAHKQKLVKYLSRLDYKSLDTPTLEKIVDLINQKKPKE